MKLAIVLDGFPFFYKLETGKPQRLIVLGYYYRYRRSSHTDFYSSITRRDKRKSHMWPITFCVTFDFSH